MAFSISAWRRWSRLQFQGVAVPVGDAVVIAVGGEQGQLRAWRGLHPPDDEPHRFGAGLALKGGVGGLRHVGGAVHPVADRRPFRLGYGLDEVAQALVLPNGDGETEVQLAADRDDGVGVEAAVGPHRELSFGPGVSAPRSQYLLVDVTNGRRPERCWRGPR